MPGNISVSGNGYDGQIRRLSSPSMVSKVTLPERLLQGPIEVISNINDDFSSFSYKPTIQIKIYKNHSFQRKEVTKHIFPDF